MTSIKKQDSILDKVLEQSVGCGKCSGVGYIQGFQRYANGVCFQCNGSGKVSLKKQASKGKMYLLYQKYNYRGVNNKPVVKDELRLIVRHDNDAVSVSELIVDFTQYKGDRTKYRKLWKEYQEKGCTATFFKTENGFETKYQ